MEFGFNKSVITFRVSRRRREIYCGVVTRVCVSVCLSAAACLHYCTDPDVTWRSAALLLQHNANTKRYRVRGCTRCVPSYGRPM